MSEPLIRFEAKSDIEAIRALHETSFGSLLEAELVDNLQAEGDAVLSLVAEAGGALVGHVLFSRMVALESRGLRVTALGPLSVRQEQRGKGIGTALVRDGMRRLMADGEDLVVVLGDPAFYSRFGFSAKAAQVFQTPYDGPNLLARPLSEAGHIAQGLLRYPSAFSMLT